MAEFIAVAVQTIAAGQNALFTETPVEGGRCIIHRNGSGIVTVKGVTNQCRARFRVTFGGNIAVPAGGTAGAISLAITLNGEPLQSAVMTVTPAAVGDYFNVNVSVFVDVPCGCCTQIAVENISTQAVELINANLIVERVA